MTATLLDKAAGLLFPPRCPLCGQLAQQEDCCCPACDKQLRRLGDDAVTALEDCFVYSPFCYAPPLTQAVYRFKFQGQQQLSVYFAQEMARLLAERFGPALPFDRITYVPMPPLREQYRGYNQAQLLALELGQRFGLPVEDCGLTRQEGFAQHDLSRSMRQKQADGGFDIRPGVALSGTVLLVDDLCTTGATLRSCVRLLQGAGAGLCAAATLCR